MNAPRQRSKEAFSRSGVGVSLFTSAYRAVSRTGITELPWLMRLLEPLFFFYKRYLEDPFYVLAQKHPELFANGHILDVGANIGYTASVFSEAASPGFNVFAFEPEVGTFAQLAKRALKKTPRRNLQVFHMAVGAQCGSVDLWRNPQHQADHRIATSEFRKQIASEKTSTVALTSLDDFCEKHAIWPVSFIKIDVQGYEFPVCEGMQKVLAANPRSCVAFEYHLKSMTDLGIPPMALLDFFFSRKFEIVTVGRRGNLVPCTKEYLLGLVKDHEYVDVLCLPRNAVNLK